MISSFTCEVVNETVELEVSEVGGLENLRQRIEGCSHARQCGVAQPHASGCRFHWANCPYVSRQKPLPIEAHIA